MRELSRGYTGCSGPPPTTVACVNAIRAIRAHIQQVEINDREMSKLSGLEEHATPWRCINKA